MTVGGSAVTISLAAGATTTISPQSSGVSSAGGASAGASGTGTSSAGTSDAGPSTKATPVQVTGNAARVRGAEAQVAVWAAAMAVGLMVSM